MEATTPEELAAYLHERSQWWENTIRAANPADHDTRVSEIANRLRSIATQITTDNFKLIQQTCEVLEELAETHLQAELKGDYSGCEWLTETDLTERWSGKVSIETLRSWRKNKRRGPTYHKFEYKVLYRLSDIEAYERAGRRVITK